MYFSPLHKIIELKCNCHMYTYVIIEKNSHASISRT